MRGGDSLRIPKSPSPLVLLETMPIDPHIRDHQVWLGYLQPDGLVVSPAALVDAGVSLNTNTLPLQQRFLQSVTRTTIGDDNEYPAVVHFATFAAAFLEWPEVAIFGQGMAGRDIPDCLKIGLKEFGEVLEPTWALTRHGCTAIAGPDDVLLLIQELPLGADLDATPAPDASRWSASPTRRFERLLRETRVPIGLLVNGRQFRLVYAPRGENAGSLTFPVSAMCEVGGRPILAAFEMLLRGHRLFAAPTGKRLSDLLIRSREYQSRVSTALAGQVLESLYELVRGFQAANEHTKGELLRDVLARDPDEVYGGLLNVLLRLVFLLFTEDRGLMPASPLYIRHYSVHGLFERLRVDAEHYPDTMDQRYGAWAQLLALFRAVHAGCRHADLRMPAREGYLFDPTRFPFLENVGQAFLPAGQTGMSAPRSAPRAQPSSTLKHSLPLVSDGVIFRVLEKFLILDGERLSYRTLDVEQIGSVYQIIMGFRLELATGNAIGIRPAKAHGAPVIVNLDELLTTKPGDRGKWLQERTDQKLTGEAATGLTAAQDIDALLAALERKIARGATPAPVVAGAMVLQPTDERRRSGSHYTPRSLTEPSVRKTLEPLLRRFGPNPTPGRILDLKICDPAMGSGAFLVETCRQLADVLVAAWQVHGGRPVLPPDEDELLLARRIVAQRCLYGVDRNPMATDLAKLSLWLATLAKDHPFTFLDHALRTGDTLVGLSRHQIEAFHWDASKPPTFIQHELAKRIESALRTRRQILDADDQMPPGTKAQKLAVADDTIQLARDLGDACVSAFFSADKTKAREQRRGELLTATENYLTRHDYTDAGGKAIVDAAKSLRTAVHPIPPFHWEIEFPEVFSPDRGGFDGIAGNPPFAGKNTLLNSNRLGYLDWLQVSHAESHGNSDLVAHFFRRAFELLRPGGTFGLIATNTIGQGDTRQTGLRWICTHGGTIYAARKRVKWPGEAAVVVSVVHVYKGRLTPPFDLDGRQVPLITAYLFHAGGDETPAVLKANADKSFIGSYVLGMGFTFDDTDAKGVANPIALMHELIAKDPRNSERIFPYIGGEEINDSPVQTHHRYVINFSNFPLRREDLGATWANANDKKHTEWVRAGIVPLDYPNPVAADWPDLLKLVERKVKPQRDLDKRDIRRKFWWRFGENTPALYAALEGKSRVLANSQVSSHLVFTFVPSTIVPAHTTDVFTVGSYSFFATMQSSVQNVWGLFFASSLEERLRYNTSDCFATFPFPLRFAEIAGLEEAGREYYESRAALMVRNNEGLTKTYNRFHDPDETSPDILRLRELHAAMDRAVLDAYGWTDIPTDCEFILDYDDDQEAVSGDATNAPAKPSRRKKPWRYRWPDAIRDEVLTRLLALNAERAEVERLAGMAVTPVTSPSGIGPSRISRRAPSGQGTSQPDFLAKLSAR